MVKRIISSAICGVYISIGATAFIAIEDPVMAALFFSAGILMVSVFFNMLITRVVALYPYNDYNTADVFISLFGNAAGCFVYAALLNVTRFGNEARLNKLTTAVEARLNDSYASIFVLAIFCGIMVASASLSAKSLPDNRGAALALSVIFIAVFVICGHEHIVADVFYFAYYAFKFGFKAEFIPILLIVAAGNIVGGMGTGYLDRYRRK